jgi:predicted O-methyltransferase YrrM
MASEFRASDWDRYKMDYKSPFRELEPADREIAIVDEALAALGGAGILKTIDYDKDRFLAMRSAVAEQFEIPWTAISPRQQRLIYAINAIARPKVMIAAGVFCGFTFICNAGAAVGPGAVYTAKALVGVEIKPAEAERAQRNVRKIDPSGVAQILAADAVKVVTDCTEPIDLLYLDANGPEHGKGIYHMIAEAAMHRLHKGSLVLAHNSVNAAAKLEHYLKFVRDPKKFRASVNVILDGEGLEVSAR